MTKRQPAQPFPLGDYLEEELKERHISFHRCARMAAIPEWELAGLCDGRFALSFEQAKRFGAVLGTSTYLWLDLAQPMPAPPIEES